MTAAAVFKRFLLIIYFQLHFQVQADPIGNHNHKKQGQLLELVIPNQNGVELTNNNNPVNGPVIDLDDIPTEQLVRGKHHRRRHRKKRKSRNRG